ncbi:Hypothetical predicted protein [Pelobates cultripes]|uniref:Uncharacterized protein n=1 Tax=Pelobates cultripes TaxID=61616 RepID=A0AAD1SNA4_PELCU|nr:Hypothetical predicted protein [Pelobates cultripes]
MRKILTTFSSYSGPPVEYILELLYLVLNQNYFRFEHTWYQQVAGTSMGAAMAPMYANILFYRRFIDDIIMIWKKVGPTPEEMLETINNLNTPVRLTMTTNDQTTDFLDVRL